MLVLDIQQTTVFVCLHQHQLNHNYWLPVGANDKLNTVHPGKIIKCVEDCCVIETDVE